VARSAQLRLHGADAHVVWPARTPAGLAVVLVEAGDEAIGASFAEALGVVAVTATDPGVLAWSVDHAAQLGADGTAPLLAGLHGGGATAAELAIQAHLDGWPRLARQLLLHPRFQAGQPDPPRGVAPATVIGCPSYAARLRAAGVDVIELDALQSNISDNL
jgi:hypothetical protein